MAFGDTTITIVGNLADDPELRYTPSGRAVAQFRVVVNSRVKQGDRYVDGRPSYYPCVAWTELAENVAQSIGKGARVIVTGTWAQGEPYDDRNGSKHYPWELRVDAVGPDLRYATARIQKADRTSAGAAPAGGSEADPWATASPTRPAQPAGF
jgi:single-strand DNA-binding protein